MLACQQTGAPVDAILYMERWGTCPWSIAKLQARRTHTRARARENAIPIQGLAGRVPQPVNPGVDSDMTEVRYD
ncbi:hypothetical protein C8R31_102174 [Nitrosospira sp. Nsp2]|nr:hypothetical protein C8R31_102174 [Nitrosospira sp. Nsp2]